MNNKHSESQSTLATIQEAGRELEALVAGERRELDVEALLGALAAAADALQAINEIQSAELALRKDIVERISAMERAMQIVKGTPRELLNEALAQLERCPAEQLIKRHKSASARFRDTFPVNAIPGEERRGANHDWSDFRAPNRKENAGQAG